MAKSTNIFGGNADIRDNIPRDYILIPRELYTRMVEATAMYNMMDDQIPAEWDMSFLDVFNKGMDAIAYEKKQEAIEAEEKERKRQKAAEEKEKAKHRCPDPGKVKALMGNGWSAEDIGAEFNAPVAEIYEWMSQLLRGEYDAVLGGLEVR